MSENKSPQVKHTWTEHEKKAYCDCCLLASSMKKCESCPFYIPKVNTVSNIQKDEK